MLKRKRSAADILDTAVEMGLESLADSNITAKQVTLKLSLVLILTISKC
jgi:hypothetical protein